MAGNTDSTDFPSCGAPGGGSASLGRLLELHCHTVFSIDGRGTPEHLVDSAVDRGVAALSITGHNSIGSLRCGRARALGAYYRANPVAGLNLNEMILKALRIIVDGKDDGDDSRSGNELFFAMDQKPGFCQCQFQEARDCVKQAGGVMFLAHVGKSIPGDPSRQQQVIRNLVADGMDGFELYHPSNRDDHPLNQKHLIFNSLQSLASELQCPVSGGSDCHDAPGSTQQGIGSCGAPAGVVDYWLQGKMPG